MILKIYYFLKKSKQLFLNEKIRFGSNKAKKDIGI